MKCPVCKHQWRLTPSELAAEFGRRTSKAKAIAARSNGKLGGWPKGKKRKSHKPAVSVVIQSGKSDRVIQWNGGTYREGKLLQIGKPG